jgi:hypothetical protein
VEPLYRLGCLFGSREFDKGKLPRKVKTMSYNFVFSAAICCFFPIASDTFESMGFDATTRRRWLGILVLVAALGMLIAGETVLQGRLENVTFVLYWLVCLLLTTAAIVIAFLDARALRRQTRDEARDLLQNTLKEIETEAKARRGRAGGVK